MHARLQEVACALTAFYQDENGRAIGGGKFGLVGNENQPVKAF